MANQLIIDGKIQIDAEKELNLPLDIRITLPELTGSAAMTGSVFDYDQWIPNTWTQVITGSVDANNNGRLRYVFITNYASGSDEVAVSMSLSSSGAPNFSLGELRAGDFYGTPGKPIALYAKSHSAGSKIGIVTIYI